MSDYEVQAPLFLLFDLKTESGSSQMIVERKIG